MARGRRLPGATIAFIVLAPLVVLVLADWRLSSAPGRIDGAFDGLDDRPPAASDGSVTMLMLATGEGTANSPTLSWMPGDPTVVSALFVTIIGDRRGAYVEWLPLRDDVLAGVADERPAAAVAAAESTTARRVDHPAVIEWSTFAELGHDNDVPLRVTPEASSSIRREYLRQVLEYTLHGEMRKEPLMLYRAPHRGRGHGGGGRLVDVRPEPAGVLTTQHALPKNHPDDPAARRELTPVGLRRPGGP
ncbi:hypothetical protein [Nocardioides sp. B-3]|uniref:hypothetical protein n=1 Tax=Nocardioides sp. B-3 TaxID=2895565 RepID=UPI00215255FD|nr:hypothetical protein [Nocardioides sp. B-3]UUZ60433.1 hypothetical protein LP418_05940 [Nocardioides sp. B-3]